MTSIPRSEHIVRILRMLMGMRRFRTLKDGNAFRTVGAAAISRRLGSCRPRIGIVDGLPERAIELALMSKMYDNKRLNLVVIIGSVVRLAMFWTRLRQQTAVSDRQETNDLAHPTSGEAGATAPADLLLAFRASAATSTGAWQPRCESARSDCARSRRRPARPDATQSADGRSPARRRFPRP